MQLLCESYQVLSRVEIVFFLLKNTITEVDSSTLVINSWATGLYNATWAFIAKTNLPIFHVCNQLPDAITRSRIFC